MCQLIGVDRDVRLMPGKRRRSAKLSSEEISAIVAAYRRGLLQREIAEKFDVTQARISQILAPLSRGEN